jgi:mono/diheme cytochrome c family protein
MSGYLNRRFQTHWVLVPALLTLLAGCTQDMYDQPKFEVFEATDFFSDGTVARPQVPGTVAQGQMFEGHVFMSGREGQAFVATIPEPPEGFAPLPLNRATIERGQERYNIYCAPCHGRTGAGDGMIVQRGFPQPPPLYEARLINEVADGYLYDVIRNGFRRMPAYSRIAVHDRWAIVAYVRALQRSQYLPLSEAPSDIQQQFNAE